MTFIFRDKLVVFLVFVLLLLFMEVSKKIGYGVA